MKTVNFWFEFISSLNYSVIFLPWFKTIIVFYGCSEIIRIRNFTIFTVYDTIFRQFMVAFHFFSNYVGKQITSCWTFWECPILHAIPSEKFLFVDHPKEDLKEQEFKPYIIGGIPDLPEKSSKTREASIKVVQN